MIRVSSGMRRRGAIAVSVAIMVIASGAFSSSASALLHSLALNQYGSRVDATTGANFCSLLSTDTCQVGEESNAIDGFGTDSPWGVAVAPNGNIYVTDRGNHRVQELTPSGKFVLMFGKEVNETKTNAVKAKGGTPTSTELAEENSCTQVEVEAGAKCQAGASEGGAGAFVTPESIAVDPSTGNVYVAEEVVTNARVNEFTSTGKFVLMIGKEVNESKTNAVKAKGGTPSSAELEEENICTQVETEGGAKCKGGNGFGALFVNEPGALAIGTGGNEIAVGGPDDLLYVGSEHRIQEFDAKGKWVGEISLEKVSSGEFMMVQGVAVDQATGNLYLRYALYEEGGNTIYKFTPVSGKPTEYSKSAEFKPSPRHVGGSIGIEGMALDSSGHLAITEKEEASSTSEWFGSVLATSNGSHAAEISELPGIGLASTGVPGLSFDSASGELYSAARNRHEVASYIVREGAELIAKPAACKQASSQQGSMATDECTLNGEANPSEISETEAWFQWAATSALGGPGTTETTKQKISTSNALTPVSTVVGGLQPNSVYYYRVAGYDHNFNPPTPALTSAGLSVLTPTVLPEVVGVPSTSFVKSTSAVLVGELNPENAATKYEFEYGICAQLTGCASVAHTHTLQSSEYGKIGAILEAAGLHPATSYHYRLVASNSAGTVYGPEGTFVTSPPVMPEAFTDSATAVTATSASVAGRVNPDGQPAVYTFELGVYNPSGIHYGVVFSGSAGEGTTPIVEQLQLSGLQPGTTYAYRIKIDSGYGGATGDPVMFTTQGVPSVLTAPSSLAQLPVPRIAFPKATNPPRRCKSGFKRNKRGICVKVAKKKAKRKAHRSLRRHK